MDSVELLKLFVHVSSPGQMYKLYESQNHAAPLHLDWLKDPIQFNQENAKGWVDGSDSVQCHTRTGRRSPESRCSMM
jgi:hypothetical protein